METEKKQNRSSLREKADKARSFRCTTLICVLENPANINNVGAVVRNIDTLGISKLYVVDGNNVLPRDWVNMRNNRKLMNVSSSAIKWSYVHPFRTTAECLEHLNKNNFTSITTSLHQKGYTNITLSDGKYDQKKLAVWFGNESKGVTNEVLNASQFCVQIEAAGIVESLNLSVSTGIVMYTIAQQRRKNSKKNMITI